MRKHNKFYKLIHPGAPYGLLLRKPRARKQARRAKSAEMFAVIFFPKITGIMNAQVGFYNLRLSQTPEAARVKFMDDIKKGEKWATYADAGHRVRRVRIIDLGDASALPKKKVRIRRKK